MPRSIGAPSSCRTSSTALRAVAMSNSSYQPMWPIRKIAFFSSPCPPAIVTPWRSRSASVSSRDSIPSGIRAAVTTAARSSSGENSSSPIALIPARHARPSRTWRSKAFSSPSSSRSPSATSSATISETAGVKAASSCSCAFRVRRQSK